MTDEYKTMLERANSAWNNDDPICQECPHREVEFDGSGRPEYVCNVLDGPLSILECFATDDKDWPEDD